MAINVKFSSDELVLEHILVSVELIYRERRYGRSDWDFVPQKYLHSRNFMVTKEES